MYIYIYILCFMCGYVCTCVHFLSYFIRSCPEQLDILSKRDTCRLYNDYIRVIYGNGIKGPY